jgi:sRNA-binding carbon storage regulator CsrA
MTEHEAIPAEGRRCVVVDGRIAVTLVAVRKGKAKIGFTCDRAIPVHRLEVWEQIRAGRRHEGDGGPAAPP